MVARVRLLFVGIFCWIVERLWLVLGAIASLLRWLHRTAYQPPVEYVLETVVGLTEESAKSVVRECFLYSIRIVNGACAWLVAFFDRNCNFYRSIRTPGANRDLSTWETWRPSTLNWLIERDSEKERSNNDGELEKVQASSTSREIESDSSIPPVKNKGRFSGWLRRRRKPAEITQAQALQSFVNLFDPDSGWRFLEGAKRSGWVDDFRLGFEMVITSFFNFTRKVARCFFFLPVAKDTIKKEMRHSKSAYPIRRLDDDDDDDDCDDNDDDSGDELDVLGDVSTQLHRVKSMPNVEPLRTQATHSSPKTAVHLITEAGYPLEDHDVTTEDGYILTLHRLPRPTSRDAVFFQHGILDTSLSWVSNGVTGSLAFKAYEEGFDVWLGNCRANPPRRHLESGLSEDEYWRYTLNELGVKDVGAQLEYIHQVKCRELESVQEGIRRWKAEYSRQRGSIDIRGKANLEDEEFREEMGQAMRTSRSCGMLDQQEGGECSGQQVNSPSGLKKSQGSLFGVDGEIGTTMDQEMSGSSVLGSDSGDIESDDSAELDSGGDDHHNGNFEFATSEPPLPYRLRAVGHSLGGAALLIYLVMRLYKKQRHYLSRLVLLSPAGFHPQMPTIGYPFVWFLPTFTWIWERALGRKGLGVMIPGRYPRLAVFKAFQDVMRIPALRGVVNRLIRWLMNGDSSPWEYALQLPHYGVDSMPGISIHTGMHLIQLVRSRRFHMFDHGNPEENVKDYGVPTPVDLAAEYWRINIPVDFVAGTKDGVIPPACVKMHVAHMKGGVKPTYREFDYSHLEFCFTVPDDLMSYVTDRLKSGER